ncbi:hypothetical protein GWI33_021197 [Rhynchophorus ferrugineus]|uniref:Tudor domain-containing protein n=1 Tax=Rhynchophorus ferrugineus TaxID=354439 RepID=A0A834HQ45_RHYFE|nr:hypothetical protein GWI33_021197 [Rhynchophorus ferrugineus]
MEHLNISVSQEEKFIPMAFNMTDWTIMDIYELKVVHVNTPLDFWVVKDPEEFELFYRYLNSFYSIYGNSFKLIPSKCREYKYCVVHVDSVYYRAILITDPLIVESAMQLQAYLVDYGFIVEVKPTELFCLAEEMYEIPQFAIRATLAGSKMYESVASPEDVDNFKNEVDQQILLLELRGVDFELGVIHLDFIDIDSDSDSE